jgi:hypothetical protein
LWVEIAKHSSVELSRNDLRNMTYLQNVLKESKFATPKLLIYRQLLNPIALRLYPSIPVNTCIAVKTTVLLIGGGLDRKSLVLIPKGSAVAYSVYSMH